MRIRAASLEVQNNASEKDRREMKRVMDEEVLETAQYPEITFETTSVATKGNDTGSFQAELEGKLTLHGVTRALRVPVQVAVIGRYAARLRRIHAAADRLPHQVRRRWRLAR